MERTIASGKCGDQANRRVLESGDKEVCNENIPQRQLRAKAASFQSPLRIRVKQNEATRAFLHPFTVQYTFVRNFTRMAFKKRSGKQSFGAMSLRSNTIVDKAVGGADG